MYFRFHAAAGFASHALSSRHYADNVIRCFHRAADVDIFHVIRYHHYAISIIDLIFMPRHGAAVYLLTIVIYFDADAIAFIYASCRNICFVTLP